MTTRGSWAVMPALCLAAGLAADLALGAGGTAGTASGTFLNIGGSSRALAMGGACAAVNAEAAAVGLNPGQLAGLKTPEFSFTHGQWVSDILVNQMYLAGPLAGGAVGGGVSVMDMGTIESFNASGAAEGTVEPSDMALSFCYAVELDKAGLGVGVSYVRSTLTEDFEATGFSTDLGGRFNILPEAKLSASLRNVGPALKYDEKTSPLPFTVRGGLSVTLIAGRVVLAVDGVKPSDADFGVCTGGELVQELADEVSVALRGGWKSIAPKGSNAGISAGGGFNWHPKKPLGTDEAFESAFGSNDVMHLSGLRLDYAWTPLGELGSAHWFSFSIIF